ncbi:MAG: hypothetical protein EOP10_05185 [Proteobacteria bacterium]|nr:MAG: hypothetical protein EOP10_05185 [Pseudomonadota bacterium]
MKRTVSAAALALSISTPSFALMLPPSATKTICLDSYESETGAKFAGNCDQAANNKELALPLLDNGCADGQIALTSVAYPASFVQNSPKQKKNTKLKFDIEINNCLPPNVAQL